MVVRPESVSGFRWRGRWVRLSRLVAVAFFPGLIACGRAASPSADLGAPGPLLGAQAVAARGDVVARWAKVGSSKQNYLEPAPLAPELPGLDSHKSALERQLGADWGEQSDRDGLAGFPLIDAGNWRRVRYHGVPTFTAFSYGNDHHAITAAFTVPVEGEPSSRRCMAKFEARAIREFEALGGKRGTIRETSGRFRDQDLLIHAADGELSMFFTTYRFSVAWAAYPGYEGGCIVYSAGVLWGDDPKLAQRVRDRWVREGFERYVPRTVELPVRR